MSHVWEMIRPGVWRLVGQIDPEEARRLMDERLRAPEEAPNG